MQKENSINDDRYCSHSPMPRFFINWRKDWKQMYYSRRVWNDENEYQPPMSSTMNYCWSRGAIKYNDMIWDE